MDSTNLTPPTLAARTRVRGWTVWEPLDDDSSGMHEVLAADAAGACVVLRVPPDQETADRMRAEVAAAQLHPHKSIVQSVGVVEHDNWPVQVIEHVDGMRLDTMLLISGALSVEAACRVGWQIAVALSELHSRKPVIHHGALSTERVVIDVEGNARLRDVGLLMPQQNLNRMSPERVNGDPQASAGDDLYALGLLVAEAALGHPLELAGGFLDTRVLDGLLPERLVNALAALLAPADVRLQNAAAAARVFLEGEYSFGDGSHALRSSLERARLGLGSDDGEDNDTIADGFDVHGPVTTPDGVKALHPADVDLEVTAPHRKNPLAQGKGKGKGNDVGLALGLSALMFVGAVAPGIWALTMLHSIALPGLGALAALDDSSDHDAAAAFAANFGNIKLDDVKLDDAKADAKLDDAKVDDADMAKLAAGLADLAKAAKEADAKDNAKADEDAAKLAAALADLAKAANADAPATEVAAPSASIPSMPSLPSFSMPSFSMPSLPSFSMPSFSLPSLPSLPSFSFSLPSFSSLMPSLPSLASLEAKAGIATTTGAAADANDDAAGAAALDALLAQAKSGNVKLALADVPGGAVASDAPSAAITGASNDDVAMPNGDPVRAPAFTTSSAGDKAKAKADANTKQAQEERSVKLAKAELAKSEAAEAKAVKAAKAQLAAEERAAKLADEKAARVAEEKAAKLAKAEERANAERAKAEKAKADADAKAMAAADAKAKAAADAKPAEAAKPVKLVVAVDEPTRVSAQAHLQSCNIKRSMVGVVHVVVAAGAVRVTSDPHNGCVDKVLARLFKGAFADDEPFEIVVAE